LRLTWRNQKTPTKPFVKRVSLPVGFPSSIATSAAWSGVDFENGRNQDCDILTLNEGEVKELEQACGNFQGMLARVYLSLLINFSLYFGGSCYRFFARGMLICCRIGLNLRFESISQELFPLPTLSSKLKDLAKVLTNGVGFFLIRGLDPKQYSSEVNLIMYLGISSYIGDKRGRQDERGNMLRKYFAI
jgi:hypothetical protein